MPSAVDSKELGNQVATATETGPLPPKTPTSARCDTAADAATHTAFELRRAGAVDDYVPFLMRWAVVMAVTWRCFKP